MDKQLDLLLSKHLTRLGVPKEQWPKAKQKLLKFSQDVLTIESDGNYQSANKKSSAKGGYQFLDNSIAPAVTRLKRYVEPQDWMDKVGKNKDARTLTPQQQELLFFGDILEKTVKGKKGLGDTYIKGIIAGDNRAAYNMYAEGHHTKPDARTNVRANKQFGVSDRLNIGDVRRTDIGKQDKYKPEEEKLGLVDASRTDIGIPLKAPIIPFGGIKDLSVEPPVEPSSIMPFGGIKQPFVEPPVEPSSITPFGGIKEPPVEARTNRMFSRPSGRLTPSQQNYYDMMEASNLKAQFEQGGAVKQAQGLASLGRGEDTQLIHMTPSEIQNLQSLAQRYGGGLTVNPNTGLPEAGFLKNILPMLIGGGLAIATGGMSSAFINPWTIGGAMGLGGLAASGGDWKEGLKYGLGGFGGASLAGSLAGAGAGVAPGTATTGATGATGALPATAAEQSLFNSGALGGVGVDVAGNTTTAQGFGTKMGLKNIGKTFTSTDALGRLATNPLIKRSLVTGLGSAALGAEQDRLAALNSKEIPEIEKEKNYFPEGGYQTNRIAQNVAPLERDSFGNFVPRTSEASYFNPNDGGITQVNPSARNYYGPEGTEPNFYGGGPYGTNNTAAYTPPSPVKGPFGIMMNPSRNSDAEKYNYPVGGYQYAAQGGLMGFADGGLTRGPGDGMSDDIMTSISGQQAAALSPGEFVVPADVVSDMGNGDTGAGARQLYSMMDRVRKARGGSIEQPGAINPNEYMPA